jgi:hypothetical protein
MPVFKSGAHKAPVKVTVHALSQAANSSQSHSLHDYLAEWRDPRHLSPAPRTDMYLQLEMLKEKQPQAAPHLCVFPELYCLQWK